MPSSRPSSLRKIPLDQGLAWEVVPSTGWRAGEQLLRITTGLKDGAGNAWPREFELVFEVPRASSISSISASRFADFDMLGNVLAIASNDDGMRLFDVSNPAAPEPFLFADEGYRFAGGGSVRGVHFDTHGRAVVVGSGEQFAGQLHVLDVLGMDRQSPNVLGAYAAALWGHTTVTRAPGQFGSPFPVGGMLRRVTVLNADQQDLIIPGGEVPEGLSVSVQEDEQI